MSFRLKTVWDILEDKGWQHLPMWNGWRSPCGKHFILETMLYRLPGDVINFLETGVIRNVKIFDNGINTLTLESLGLKQHRDGRCVEMKRIK